MTIAIASGKGGTGKTTLAVNLTMYLSDYHNIVLADLDVEEPNSLLFVKGNLQHSEERFRMVPQWTGQCSLCRECQVNCVFNAVIQAGDRIIIFPNLCHSCYACSDLCPEAALPMKPFKIGDLRHFKIGNADFVESKLKPGEEMAVPLISQAVDYIFDNFKNHIMIFDAPPGTSCPVIEAVKKADFVILVAEPTPFGVNDFKLAVETMKKLNKKFALVINKAGTGNNEIYEYCKKENIDIIAEIPNDRRIAELYSKGELIFDKFDFVKNELKKIKSYLNL